MKNIDERPNPGIWQTHAPCEAGEVEIGDVHWVSLQLPGYPRPCSRVSVAGPAGPGRSSVTRDMKMDVPHAKELASSVRGMGSIFAG